VIGHLIALDFSFWAMEVIVLKFIKEGFFSDHGFPNLVPVHDVRLWDIYILFGVSKEKERKLQDFVIAQHSVVFKK
jgi:hypothetical protein